MKVFIDFSEIGDEEDFYNQLEEKINLPEYFGRNLDALYDVVTGDLQSPLHIEFVNMSVQHLEVFEDLLATLEDAEENSNGFSFSYYLEQYDDE